MKIGRNVIVASMITFCFTATLFMIIPLQAANHPYNPWIDSNDDGKLSLQDLVLLANSYGTSGNPLTKAGLLFDSGWINVTGMQGQTISITDDLNITDWNDPSILVEITGKTSINDSIIQRSQLSPVMGFDKTLPDPHYAGAVSGVQTSDGGFALAGFYETSLTDMLLVKTNSTGNLQWWRNFDYPGWDEQAYDVIQTSDGGYMVVGWTSGAPGWYDFWLVRTDTNGNMLWNKTYGGPNPDEAYSVVQTPDGGFAVLGYTETSGMDLWLVKTDVNGNMEWNQTYDYAGSVGTLPSKLIQTYDGGFTLLGYIDVDGKYDSWLIKTDALGNAQWNKTCTLPAYSNLAYDVVQTLDGGFAMACETFNATYPYSDTDFLLVRTDTNGNVVWTRTYGGGQDDVAYALLQTLDGGFALAGETNSFGAGGTDSWLVRTDASGNMLWNKTYGGLGYDRTRDLIRTLDGGFVLVGYSASPENDYLDRVWLVKTDAHGETGPAGFDIGVALIYASANDVTLYRGPTDSDWNFVRVQIWQRKTP